MLQHMFGLSGKMAPIEISLSDGTTNATASLNSFFINLRWSLLLH